MFFWATIVYISIYLAMHAKAWQSASATIPVYNVLVATLQLVASRFYAAAETPYNLVLIGILAARGWLASYKLVLKFLVHPDGLAHTSQKVPGYFPIYPGQSRISGEGGRGGRKEGWMEKKKRERGLD